MNFKYLIMYLDGGLPPVGTNDEQVAITANKDDDLGVVDMVRQVILGDGAGFPDLVIKEQTIYQLG